MYSDVVVDHANTSGKLVGFGKKKKIMIKVTTKLF